MDIEPETVLSEAVRDMRISEQVSLNEPSEEQETSFVEVSTDEQGEDLHPCASNFNQNTQQQVHDPWQPKPRSGYGDCGFDFIEEDLASTPDDDMLAWLMAQGLSLGQSSQALYCSSYIS